MSSLSVAAALRRFLPPFLLRYNIPSRIIDTFKRLSLCHTGKLGWSLIECQTCSDLHWTPNGCGDRHCPDCHSRQRELWLKHQRKDLLPVRYYHWVFTVPAALRPLFLQNQKLLYTLLFTAAANTLLEFGLNEFNAHIGLTALLHTWGQNLFNHPHLHCLVTGGGLSFDPQGKPIWVGPKQSRFLFPVHAVAAMFAAKFIHGLVELNAQGKLQFHGKLKALGQPVPWAQLMHSLAQRKWIVFAKGSVVGPDALLQYLGRYTHRVAITNSRILAIDDNTVTFRYKDYAQQGKIRDLVLSGVEFVRRLSLHILPPGFTKVRHYGILGNNRRKKSLPLARQALESSSHRVELSPVPVPVVLTEHITCEVCGGVDLSCVGRTDSQGKFSGLIKGARRRRLRAGEPPRVLDTS